MTRVANWVGAVTLALLACSGGKSDEAAKRTAAADAGPKEAPLELHPFWVDSQYVQLNDEGKCPEGLWSLFATPAPGETPADKKAAEATRAGLASGLRGKTFVTHLVGPSYVNIGEYDSSKGEVTITVSGTVDCTDDAGRVTFAFGKPEAQLPEGRDFGQYQWTSAPLTFPYKVKMSEARTFQSSNKAGLEARVVFELGKAEVHKKLIRNEVSAEERAERKKHGIPDEGGGMEDWGAGRLMRVKILGVRVASKGGRDELVMSRTP